MILRHKCWLFLAVLIFPGMLTAQSDDLLARVLAGVQQSHAKIATDCGTVTEVRTSKLMTKPMVLHGRFCAAGSDRFMLEYAEPHPMSIRFNENYLNVTIDGGKTQVMNVDRDVRRAQDFFGGENSIKNLEKNFTVTAEENDREYAIRLVPRSQTFHHKLDYLVVKLNKRDFLPRSLEVDGKSGVNSVFTIDVTSTNIKLPEDTFRVIKTK